MGGRGGGRERAQPPGVSEAIIAVGLVGTPAHAGRLRPFLRDDDPVRRAAAAIALARLDVLDPEVFDELASVCATWHADEPQMLFLDGDLRGYAASSLIRHEAALPPQAVDAVLDGLARTSGPQSLAITSAALRLVFGELPLDPLPPYEELDDQQRRTVNALAGMDRETWQLVNFTEILRAWGLPDEQQKLSRYAERPPAH